MPRTFTANERAYIARLVARNFDDLTNTDQGLESPMPADERMRRMRIREKARTAIRDLAMVQLAGLLDESVASQVDDELTMASMVLPDADPDERFWRAIGSPPEDVDLSSGGIEVQTETMAE